MSVNSVSTVSASTRVSNENAMPTASRKASSGRMLPLLTGLLLIVGAVSGRASAVASVGTVTQFCAGITPMGDPQDIAPGPEGDMWFTEYYHRIGRITPEGIVTEFSEGLSSANYPSQITTGADGNLWFTDEAGIIGRSTQQGVISLFSEGLTPHSEPIGIIAGPEGDIWFAEYDGNQIGRITPQGAVTEFSTGITPESGLGAIVAGAEGNIWFTENISNQIGRITPQGVVTEFSTGIAPNSGIDWLTAGPDGNLWFTESNTDQIGRITPQGVVTEFSAEAPPGSHPLAITAGPDGNIWFTEDGVDDIGRITPQGAVTQFSVGSGLGQEGLQIAGGPQGTVWFTEGLGCIGRIVATETYPPSTSSSLSLTASEPGGAAKPATVSIRSTDSRVGPGGATTVRLSCSAGTGRCRGALTLVATHGASGSRHETKTIRLATVRFSIARAHSALIKLRLSMVGRQVLARSPNGKLPVEATATANENTVHRMITLYTIGHLNDAARGRHT